MTLRAQRQSNMGTEDFDTSKQRTCAYLFEGKLRKEFIFTVLRILRKGKNYTFVFL